ncbi:MAG TPA: hypothetical protein VGM45_08805 [Gaiellaceae bacterium]|jgi:hypothetical protein
MTTATARLDRAPKPHPERAPGARTRPLEVGALACRSCGQAVTAPEPSRRESLTTWPLQPLSALSRGVPLGSEDVTVTRCDECTSRQVRARALVTVLSLGSIPGPGETEVERLDAALAALDLLGIRGDRSNSLTRNAEDVRELIDALAPFGGEASWGAHVQRRTVGAAEAASRRWAHVDPELTGNAWHRYGELIRHGFESPSDCPPPERDGAVRACLLCGRGSLRVKPSDAERAWGDLRRVQPGELGGDSRPELVAGFLCPTCRVDVERAGAPGLPAVDRALLRVLGYSLSSAGRFTRPLGRAWVAMAPGTSPNSAPWGHLDTVRLARALDAAPFVHRAPSRGERQRGVA